MGSSSSSSFLSYPIENVSVETFGNLDYNVAHACTQGWRRTQEDRITVSLKLRNHPKVAFFALFDGHGGFETAEYASKHFVKYFEIMKDPMYGDIQEIIDAFMNFDQEILNHPNKKIGDSGCTAVVVLSSREDGRDSEEFDVRVAHIGDSRCIISEEIGGCPIVLSSTQDHKPENKQESDRIYRAGGWVSENRVNSSLSISRVFGNRKYKIGNKDPLLQQVIARPTIEEDIRLFADCNPKIALVCDGNLERQTNQDIVNFIYEESSRASTRSCDSDNTATFNQEVAENLVRHSLSTGSTDNISVVLISFENGSNYGGQKYYKRRSCTKEQMCDERFVKAYIADAAFHDVFLTKSDLPTSNYYWSSKCNRNHDLTQKKCSRRKLRRMGVSRSEYNFIPQLIQTDIQLSGKDENACDGNIIRVNFYLVDEDGIYRQDNGKSLIHRFNYAEKMFGTKSLCKDFVNKCIAHIHSPLIKESYRKTMLSNFTKLIRQYHNNEVSCLDAVSRFRDEVLLNTAPDNDCNFVFGWSNM